MNDALKDELVWFTIAAPLIFVIADVTRTAFPAVVYACEIIALIAFVRAIYRLVKKREGIAWLAASVSLITVLILGLIIFVVIGLP